MSSANLPVSSAWAALMNSASSAPIGLDGRCLVVSHNVSYVAWRSNHVDGRALENQSVGKHSASDELCDRGPASCK